MKHFYNRQNQVQNILNKALQRIIDLFFVTFVDQVALDTKHISNLLQKIEYKNLVYKIWCVLLISYKVQIPGTNFNFSFRFSDLERFRLKNTKIQRHHAREIDFDLTTLRLNYLVYIRIRKKNPKSCGQIISENKFRGGGQNLMQTLGQIPAKIFC